MAAVPRAAHGIMMTVAVVASGGNGSRMESRGKKGEAEQGKELGIDRQTEREKER